MHGGLGGKVPPFFLRGRDQSLLGELFGVDDVALVDRLVLGAPVGEALAQEVVETGGVGRVDLLVVDGQTPLALRRGRQLVQSLQDLGVEVVDERLVVGFGDFFEEGQRHELVLAVRHPVLDHLFDVVHHETVGHSC